MQRIVPNVWCQGNAQEAGSFYADVFPQATMEVVAFYPTEDLPDFQREFAGQPLVIDVTVGGYRIRLINAGNDFWPTPALSFILNIDAGDTDGSMDEARGRITTLWESLSEGGRGEDAVGAVSTQRAVRMGRGPVRGELAADAR